MRIRTAAGLGPVLVMTLALSGCAGAAPASPTPEPTPSPTATPEPTPDVAALFSAQFETISSGVSTLEGTLQVGDVKVTMSGTSTFNDPDEASSILTGVGGQSVSIQTVKVAGVKYVKTGTGPWLVDPSPASPKQLSGELKKLLAGLTDAGVETRRGVEVHKLLPKAGSTIDPVVLGGAATGITGVSGTIVFYAKADGTPTEVVIDLTWSQPAGDASAAGKASFVIAFDKLGSKPPVVKPLHVWQVYASKALAYAVAYPDDFDQSTDEGTDYYNGPEGQFIGISRDKKLTYTLNEWVAAEISSIKQGFATKTVTNTETVVGGEKARFLSATGTNSNKEKVVLYEAVAIHGSYVYWIYWIGPVGQEAADLAEFQQVLASFTFK